MATEIDRVDPAEPPPDGDPREPRSREGSSTARLRLYLARSTPNSVRAERNLATVLKALPADIPAPALEVIDVFQQPKRAITDGVVVTPMLIGSATDKRFVLMGDLADQTNLRRYILDLVQPT